MKTGETLSDIAQRYGSSRQVLAEVNQLSNQMIKAGQHLLVVNSQIDFSRYPVLSGGAVSDGAKTRINYTVQSGESLWWIARRHDLEITDIERWNSISRRKALHPGQQLVLWTRAGSQARPAGPTHTVVSGDNLWDLARKYSVGVKQLRQWNNLKSQQWLKLGQVLRLRAPRSNPSHAPVRKLSYSVRAGDSLARIAKKFGVSIAQLCDWNGIQAGRYLQPGQSLRVHVPVNEQWRDA